MIPRNWEANKTRSWWDSCFFFFLSRRASEWTAIWTCEGWIETATKCPEFLAFDVKRFSKQPHRKLSQNSHKKWIKKTCSRKKVFEADRQTRRKNFGPRQINPSAGKQPQLHLWYWKYFNYKQIDCLCHMLATQRTLESQTEHETITKKLTALVIKQHFRRFELMFDF